MLCRTPLARRRLRFVRVAARRNLYASRSALWRLAEFVREGSAADIALELPPARLRETSPACAVRVLGHEHGPVTLRAVGHDLEIEGGAIARGLLAATLENLAGSPPTNTSLTRHVDLECFPDHSFLSDESMWISVYLDVGAPG